ncbi:MAG: glutathione S-transferase family protein [Variovorax sp.]|jgi:glutathione S-transferase|nr:MAG: glutathione S-transferase family protein [Variovorax sp.]
MITLTALKWVPPFAQGQVRDHRVRWVLKEVGWPYRVELIDTVVQQDAGYRLAQPFGQVPLMREDGRPTLFETGAIVLDVATRSGRLLPGTDAERAHAVCWLFAALNSVEPFLAQLAEVDFFMKDEADKARRRPGVIAMVDTRLGQLDVVLRDREYLAGDDFTIADLMMSSVMKVIGHTDLLDRHAAVKAHRDRCFARPAYREAIAEQRRDIAAHGPRDMKYASA